MSGLVAPALSAFFGLIVGLSLQVMKSHRDELRVICEDLCRLIADAADAGAKYWSSTTDLPLQEARLVGFQSRMSGYSAILAEHLHSQAVEDMNGCLEQLFATLTGGEFETPDRPADLGRARLCQDFGADAILAVRQGFFDTVSLKRKLERVTTRRRTRWYGKFADE